MRRERARIRRRRMRSGRRPPEIPQGYFYRRVEIAGRVIEEIIPLELHPKMTVEITESLEYRGVL